MKAATIVICVAILLCIAIEVGCFMYDLTMSYIERNRK
jgi:hypothetical protein